jgi:peptide/nickel transport system ATP-binding protein
MNILHIQHVTKTYGAHRAVDDVSLALQAGDNLAIVGESGCGKTTLAKMIMGLVKPDTGTLQAPANGLQMVFQDPQQSLDPLWNIREILKEGLWRQRGLSREKVQEKLAQVLIAVGLSPQVLTRFAHEFSGGERQRIAIARALLAEPRVLILDEAVSALDTATQTQIIGLLRKLKKEFRLTYVFISHNLRLVADFSDKIIVMYKGKIVEEGRARQVLQAPVHPYTQQLVSAAFFKDL